MNWKLVPLAAAKVKHLCKLRLYFWYATGPVLNMGQVTLGFAKLTKKFYTRNVKIAFKIGAFR